jgi:hypothetical protein
MGSDESNSIPAGKSKFFPTPRLASDGSNWITWKKQTLTTLMSIKGVDCHINGTARIPPPIPTYPNGYALTDDEVVELEKLEEKWDSYNQRENSIKAQILAMIPESIAIEIQTSSTGKEIWDTLCRKHEQKALMVTVDLRCRIYALKCMDDSNVKTHIQSLVALYEQLK